MPHWRTCFDSEYVGSWDLPRDRDTPVTIESVTRGKITGKKGRSASKAIIRLVGKKKPFAANITNCRAIAGMYGNDVRGWAGKRIALYVTMTQMEGEDTECIRVRPRPPGDEQSARVPPTDVAPSSEPPDDGDFINDEQEAAAP